ncbi:MAG: YjbF family lipoprotein [Alphaproteobacteria bacterium]
MGAADHPRAWRLTRRAALLGLTATGLSACIKSDNVLLRHVQLLTGTFKVNKGLTREDVAKFQAASIAARFGGGQEVLILLQRVEGRNLYWLSTDRVMLVTRGGRLVQTAGFPNDLAHTSFIGPDPVDRGLLRAHGQMSVRQLDYDDFGLALFATSKYRVVKKDPIRIIGATIPTVRVTEKVRMRSLKWHYTNTYWVHEETGVVWQSRQRFHPDHPALTITTMRPVREDVGAGA